MSFCSNTSQQMHLSDPIYQLTDREQKRLKNSWAEKFSNDIFPLINEERFSVIYSDNPATRPNNPVNVYFGLLILKEIFTQTDEECIDSLMFDVRYQYALHTTSFKEQPISKNSLSNFRMAVYRYNEKHGVDIIQEEIESHAKEFTKLLNIDGRTIRMDSLMISSSCKKLSRLEIIYSCVSRLITIIRETKAVSLPEMFNPYLEEGHKNDTIYRCKGKDIQSKLNTVIKDAKKLYRLYKDMPSIADTEEFHILSRMFFEQTKQNSLNGSIELKPAKEISPESLQNPTDPDATYRKKGNNGYVGYSANIVESFDDDNRIITHYDLKKNTYSDQAFSKDIIDKLGKQSEPTKLLVDGTYYSEDISKKAAENNMQFIPTGLVGRRTNDKRSGYRPFKIDEANRIVICCPMGHTPISSKYKRGTYKAYFLRNHCDDCPFRPNCPVTEQKKRYMFKVSETKLHRLILEARMGTEKYRKISTKRAGIEGVPSALRRQYDIDNLPVRGQVRSKIWLGFKIGAINCKRYIKGSVRSPKDAPPAINAVYLLQVLCFQRTVAAI